MANRYESLGLPVGVLVIDYKNQLHDGDFAPDPSCYPSVRDLSDGVRAAINATTMFSFWPEVRRPDWPRLLLLFVRLIASAEVFLTVGGVPAVRWRP